MKNDFTDSFITAIQLNTAINQTAKNIELTVVQKLENYSTTEEMNVAITLTAQQITQEVNKKVGEEELGTLIEQNWEHVKYAWNKITEYLQMEVLNKNASLVVRNESKELLMALDKLGQHFFKSGCKEIGTIGLVEKDGKNYLAFSLKAENTNDGMAWGIEIDNKFYPVFELTQFSTEGGAYGGILTMISMLYMSNNPIKLMDSYLYGDINNTVEMTDTNGFNILNTSGTSILSVSDGYANIANVVNIYDNTGGTKSLKFGECILSDFGTIVCYDLIETSESKYKENIKKIKKRAISIIKDTDVCSFNYKGQKHKKIGFVIDEKNKKYKCDKSIIKETEDRKGIDLYSVSGILWKAIQEQQEEIEKLQEKDKEKDDLIKSLIKRIEKLEVQNGKN